LRRLLSITALLGVAGGLGAAPASAQSPAVIVKVHQASGLVSPYFQLSASTGRTVRAGGLELVNPTSRTVRVRLDPVDAITTNTLGSAYSLAGEGAHGPTTWLRLRRRNVTIAPHASRTVSVSLAVPPTAEPGDYLTGVSVEALDQTQTTSVSQGVAVGEIDRYAIGVEVKVPGPRHPALRFTGAAVAREPGGLAFLVSATNPGNVILKGVHGWVRVIDGDRVVAATTIQPGTFVSGTAIRYPLLAHHEQPAPGKSFRVRAALYYAGGAARLDTAVRFSHSAAVTQQNYGGRKLPQPTPPWRWIVAAVLAVAVAAGLRWGLRRRGRPLSRAAAIKLLERGLAPGGDLPVSVVLVSAERDLAGTIADTVRPRLRRSDRICDLGEQGLIVICPATGRAAATALRRDLYEHFARHPELADRPISVTASTAVKSTTPAKLLARVKANHQRQTTGPASPPGPRKSAVLAR
jgi:hypothetical protein